MYYKDPEVFEDKTFNEFNVVDLKDTLTSVGFDLDLLEGDSFYYYDAYVRKGFGLGYNCSSNTDLDIAFNKATDIKPLINKIKAPLLIYFSKDDPFLSTYDPKKGQPEAINEVLQFARNKDNIIVFNPDYGAHTGALLDPDFKKIIERFFY